MATCKDIFVNAIKGLIQLFDFYSDCVILKMLYYQSIDPKNEDKRFDYIIALIVSFTSLGATYMAT